MPAERERMSYKGRIEETVVLLEEWVSTPTQLLERDARKEEEKQRLETEEDEHSCAMRKEFLAQQREFYIAVRRWG